METTQTNKLAGERTQNGEENRQAFQTNFVESLIESIRREVTGKILRCEVPESWDGIELRQYLADKFNDSTFPDLLNGKRKRDYKNTMIVNNL